MAWNASEVLVELDAYEQELISHGFSDHAVTTYVDQSRRYLRWRTGDFSPRGAAPRRVPISPLVRVGVAELEGDLVEYEEYLASAGLAPATVRTYWDQSGRFVDWLAGSYKPGSPKRGRALPAAPRPRRAGVSRETGAVERRRASDPSCRGMVSAPTLTALLAARDRYREIEARDLFYRAATDLVRRARDDQASPLTLGEAVAVLLFSWNSALYRYTPATVDHVARIESLLTANLPALDRWRPGELHPAALLGESTEIAATFTDFETLLGPVGGAKALHLLAPGFFPIWDDKIAAAYGCRLGKAGTNGRRYVRFMSCTAEQCQRLRGELGVPADLVKALDEWNYVTITRK